jgi:hypothetical protein
MPLRYWLCSGLSLDPNTVGHGLCSLFVRHVGCRYSGDKYGRIDVKSPGNLDDVVKAQVACATLDLADECPVHSCELRERLLADAEPKSLCPNPLTEHSSGIGFRLTHAS